MLWVKQLKGKRTIMINACFGLERTMILFIWTDKCNLLYCICWSTVKITGDGIASVWFWRQNNLRLGSTSLLCIVILNTWNMQLRTLLLAIVYFKCSLLQCRAVRTVYILLGLLWFYSNLLYLLYALNYTLVVKHFPFLFSMVGSTSVHCSVETPLNSWLRLISMEFASWWNPTEPSLHCFPQTKSIGKPIFAQGEYSFLKSSFVHMIGSPRGWAKVFVSIHMIFLVMT